MNERQSIIASFSYMSMKGPLSLNAPNIDIGILSEYFNPSVIRKNQDVELRRMLMGTKLGDGQRALIDAYDLKKRK